MFKKRDQIILVLFSCFFLSGFIAQAQKFKKIRSEGDFYYLYQIKVKPGTSNEIILPVFITGISIELNSDNDFSGTSLETGQGAVKVRRNEHDADLQKNISQLINFEPMIDRFIIHNHSISETFILHAYYTATVTPLKKKDVFSGGYDCSEPEAINQSVWRAGLPAPAPNPDYTKTEHIVIHHTAGSNSISDHLTVVRNIYLYHTQSNGWDDIGYNYLIARDGTIYKGRDGQTKHQQDFVKGAHFCGKNNHTLGIGVLGTYTDVVPTAPIVESLSKLILWKLHKDQLTALDSFLHPKSGTEQLLLPRICGHRDGCATECPGISFYQLLPEIRNSIDSLLKKCPPLAFKTVSMTDAFSVYPNPTDGSLFILTNNNEMFFIVIHDLNGKEMIRTQLLSTPAQLQFDFLTPSVYLLSIFDQSNNFIHLQKLVVIDKQ